MNPSKHVWYFEPILTGTHIVLNNHAFSSKKVHVSARVGCVQKNLKVCWCVIFHCLVCDAVFPSVTIFKVCNCMMPGVLKMFLDINNSVVNSSL